MTVTGKKCGGTPTQSTAVSLKTLQIRPNPPKSTSNTPSFPPPDYKNFTLSCRFDVIFCNNFFTRILKTLHMPHDKDKNNRYKKVQVRLTPLQWTNIHTRIRMGEKKADLAREYGITRQAINYKFAGVVEESPIETAAAKIVLAHEYANDELQKLPPKVQEKAWDMAKALMSISESLTEGAMQGAINFRKLSTLANEMTEEMLDKGGDAQMLAIISAITKTANEAAAPSLNLLNINKQTVDRLTKTGDIVGKKTLADFYGIGLSDGVLDVKTDS